MITEFKKYRYDGGSICPICACANFGDWTTSKDDNYYYHNYSCEFCNFEWYVKYKIVSKTTHGIETKLVARYSKKSNKKIVVGGTPPKNSFDELKIAARDYNL